MVVQNLVRTKTVTMEKRQRQLIELEQTRTQLAERLTSLEEELASPFTSKLNAEEQARLRDLEASVQALEQSVRAAVVWWKALVYMSKPGLLANRCRRTCRPPTTVVDDRTWKRCVPWKS